MNEFPFFDLVLVASLLVGGAVIGSKVGIWLDSCIRWLKADISARHARPEAGRKRPVAV